MKRRDIQVRPDTSPVSPPPKVNQQPSPKRQSTCAAMYKEVIKGGTSGYTILRREEDTKKAAKKPTEPKPAKNKRESAKLLPISEILNNYKREKEQHEIDQTRRNSVNIEIPEAPMAKEEHKTMSRFTALENRNIQKS